MNWALISKIIQIFISVLLVFLVIIQSKGSGLSGFLGGSVGFYGSRRGIEKIVFIATCILGGLLVINCLFMIVV